MTAYAPKVKVARMKRTPLYDDHLKLNARMVEFAGWQMPIQYEGVRQEHLNVREKVGIFDVSHMGEIWVRGPKALATLQWLTTNDVAKLKAGEAHYSLFPNAEGGVVDDLIVYCVQPDQEYLLCVNASNIDKDFAFLQKNNLGADIKNESDAWGQIAVQGPRAVELTNQVLGRNYTELSYFHFAAIEYRGAKCWLARTGYTGEDGFEIFVPRETTSVLWNAFLQQGEKFGIKPIGLAARDTLRTEMKYCLYGHEINDTSNPYEAGLGWVVKPKAKDFLGRQKILSKKEAGLANKLVAFKVLDKGIPREGYGLFSFDNKEIGKVTSGTMSPSLNIGVGIGYVSESCSIEGTEIFVDIRGRKVKAQVVKAALTKSAQQ